MWRRCPRRWAAAAERGCVAGLQPALGLGGRLAGWWRRWVGHCVMRTVARVFMLKGTAAGCMQQSPSCNALCCACSQAEEIAAVKEEAERDLAEGEPLGGGFVPITLLLCFCACGSCCCCATADRSSLHVCLARPMRPARSQAGIGCRPVCPQLHHAQGAVWLAAVMPAACQENECEARHCWTARPAVSLPSRLCRRTLVLSRR